MVEGSVKEYRFVPEGVRELIYDLSQGEICVMEFSLSGFGIEEPFKQGPS